MLYVLQTAAGRACTGANDFLFFFSFGIFAEHLITVSTGERPTEHTEWLSLDNISLHCILKAQQRQNPAVHAYLI